MMKVTSAYDPIAGMYNALWFDWYLPSALPALEQLFFSKIGLGARVLDVCCGPGHVTRELVRRGYRVTGVDNSSELILLARKHLPDAVFHVQDVLDLDLPAGYDAAICTFDSLNHILTLAELRRAFTSIRRQLRNGALFVFDMNLPEAYSVDMKQWTVDIHDNSVGLVRGEFEVATGKARTELMWFSRAPGEQESWLRRHSVVRQQCYTLKEIIDAVWGAGFEKVESTMAESLGVKMDLGFGRVFVSAVA